MLGERLRSAREAAGLSTKELHERTRLSIRAIERAESGKTTPRLSALLAWADACGVSLSDLATDDTVSTNGRGASAAGGAS